MSPHNYIFRFGVDSSLTPGAGEQMFITESIPIANDHQETQVMNHAPPEEWQNTPGIKTLLEKEVGLEA